MAFGIFGQARTVVGLDIGSYAIKAVAVAASGDRLTLQGYAVARIEGADLAPLIRTVMHQLGVKTRHMVTSVSGRSVIVRQIETPRLGADELKAHIIYEADKYIPFGAEEVIIDAQPLPEAANAEKGQLMPVMLVAVRKTFVQDHVNQLKAAGFTPEIVDVDVFALANGYELLGPGVPSDAAKRVTALIDIGAAKSNIAIVQGARVLFTREVYLAGNEISDAIARTFNEQPEAIERLKLEPGETLHALIDAAMPAFEDLANEIRLSFDFVEGQFDMEVAMVVLAGGSSRLPTIASVLGTILNRPVHVFDPLAGLDLVPDRYDVHGLDASSPSLAVALGLAAHLLGFPRTSLGGQQSHNWQPRHAHAAATPSGSPPPAVPAKPQPVSASGGGRQTPAPRRAVSDSLAPLPPPVDEIAPPAPIAPPPPPVIQPSPSSRIPVGGDTSKTVGRDDTGTGLVVVLEDDQSLPASERIEKTAGKKIGLAVIDENLELPAGSKKPSGKSRLLKVENFDDSKLRGEPTSGDDVDLPEAKI